MALTPDKPSQIPAPDGGRKPAQDDAFLREVDEAVRQDQMAHVAKRYGIPILVGLVIGLAAFGGWLYWRHNQDQEMQRNSEELVRAIDQISNGHLDTANSALAPIAEEGSTGAQAAAKLMRGGIAAEQGQNAEAAKIFDEVAKDESVPQPYRDLALIRSVATNFDALAPKDVIARLKPLAKPGNPWFGSAGELVGIAYLKQDRADLAGPLFASIAKDEDVPESLRARARQISGMLGVDAIVDIDDIVTPENEPQTDEPVPAS